MSTSPLISVIIPAFNREAHLPAALASVRAQNHAPMEIIVVDDGSTDHTGDAARAGGAVCIRQANMGPAGARNTGIKAARGEFIAFLDSDDEWLPGKTARQLAILAADPQLDIVVGCLQLLRKDARRPAAPAIPSEIWFGFNVGSTLMRTRVFDRVGLFDATIRSAEDVDWFLRAQEKGARLATMPEVVQYYRQHESNMTADRNGSNLALLAAIKKSLDRRREGPPQNAVLPRIPGLAALQELCGIARVGGGSAPWRSGRA